MSTDAPAAPERGEVLSSVPLLATLPPAVFEQLIDASATRLVDAGEWCVRAGDPADGLYVVVHGRLATVVGGELRGELCRGDVFGEIGLLTGEPRTADVRALRDSEVLFVPRAAFEATVEHDPVAMRQLARVVVERLVGGERSPPAGRRVATIGLFAADPAGVAYEMGHEIAAALAECGPVAVVGPGDAPDAASRAAWAHELEDAHRYLVFLAPLAEEPWSRWCVRQSDQIVFVADASARPGRGVRRCAENLLAEAHPLAGRQGSSGDASLLLVQPAAALRPVGTHAWLDAVPVHALLQVRRHDAAHVARAARLCTGRGVGLVLGGGGPRGLAHIGVLAALEAAGVPVDAVGGTSIGALVAAGAAIGLSATACQDRTVQAIERAGRLFPPTVPVLSFASPRKIRQVLEHDELLGTWRAETCWLPYFCVSANLTRAEVVVHDRGALATAVRASLSIPGILPPVRSGDDLLVDGGVLNNLPTDVMRGCPGIGTVVAVDVGVDVEMPAPDDYRDAASGWALLAARLMRRRGQVPAPNALEIMFRAKDLAARRIAIDLLSANRPDLLLRPPVSETAMFDFSGSRHLVEVARAYAEERLKEEGWEGRTW